MGEYSYNFSIIMETTKRIISSTVVNKEYFFLYKGEISIFDFWFFLLVFSHQNRREKPTRIKHNKPKRLTSREGFGFVRGDESDYILEKQQNFFIIFFFYFNSHRSCVSQDFFRLFSQDTTYVIRSSQPTLA